MPPKPKSSNTVGYGNRGAQGSTLLNPKHPAMNINSMKKK